MLLDFYGDSLLKTTPFDQECRLLADRHYSRQSVGNKQFCGNGRKLVLRDARSEVLCVWMFQAFRLDRQTGYNCALFRNESSRRSSEIILEAERMAVEKWGPHRFYTYIDPRRIASRNPGYCFKVAGWLHVSTTKSGKHLLVKE